MTTSEKFCLKFNDFQENVKAVFESSRDDAELSDVTLACEDGGPVMANHIILASSSPVFKNLMRGKRHEVTIVYMRGIKSEDLMAVVRFLYYGEAMIYHENLDSFLKIAEELKVKGLSKAGQVVSGQEDNGLQRKPALDKLY